MQYKNDTGTNDARTLNAQTYMHYYNTLKLKCLTLFKWENLPDGIPERFIEQVLFQDGKGAFVYDPSKGFLFTRCNQSGMLNVYEEPISYNCYAVNGLFRKDIKRDDMVVLRNNMLEIPTAHAVTLFATRLCKVERTIDININALKIPIVIRCKESQRQTMKNLMDKYDGNVPYIFGEKDLDVEGMSVLDLKPQYLAGDLMEYKHELLNDAHTYLGLNNANVDKKERLITDEVNANNEVIELNTEIMLSSRQLAVEQFNKQFGQNVKVTFRCVSSEVDEYEEEEDADNE